MQPDIHLHWPAVAVSVVASFALGSIWYGPLFARTWQREMGFADAKPTGREILKGSIINVIGTVMTAFVLAYMIAGWRPSAWGAGADDSPAIYGFYAALFSYIGFVLPTLLNGVAFERKSWKVFGISAVFQFLSLQAMGMILAHWR